ncbi:MAG: DUF4338 domain-containing protein [Halanaerobiales bacterium]
MDNNKNGVFSAMINKSDKILINGREFTQKEVDDIVETVEMFNNLSRTELAKTICVHLDWFTPAGNYKVSSARNLLEKLEEKGFFKLPPLIESQRNFGGLKPIKLTSKTEAGNKLEGTVSDYGPIVLEKIEDKKTKDLWNEYIERYHDLGYKRPFGARQRYFIISKVGNQPERLGCILFSAAAWALEKRDNWIGWKEEHRSKYLNGIVNNTRFLIFPWVKIKNLASKALSLAAKRIQDDWKQRYNYRPVLMETFVDEKKYKGTCYKAANWKYLGKTKGRGRQDRNREYLSTVKLIFVYPLLKDFRAYLHGKRQQWGVCQ